MDLIIIGPDCKYATFDVHAVGCRDTRHHKYRGMDRWLERHDSVRAVVESYYGPDAGSFYHEREWDTPDGEPPANAWEHYLSEFHFLPCCDLPKE